MVSLSQRMRIVREVVAGRIRDVSAPFPAFTLFFALSDGRTRAKVVHVSGARFDACWAEGAAKVQRLARRERTHVKWLRIDWVLAAEAIDRAELDRRLAQTKRNYFRQGIALDPHLRTAFLEQELNANAMLYAGSAVPHAKLNEKNFRLYASARFGPGHELDLAPSTPVYVFSTEGVFCTADGETHTLVGAGSDSGRRRVPTLTPADVHRLIENGSQYLARQVTKRGRFVYGYHPCFDRRIDAYNALRHASTTYSMIEAWEVTQDEMLERAITRAIDYLVSEHIRRIETGDGHVCAFVVDVGEEIKLGANAVAILALTRYAQVTGAREHDPLLEQLGLGIRHMQDSETGRFHHVLHASDLSVKESFRVIYYDGEAAFGLMRLYGHTQDPRWLDVVERAFEYFIQQGHETAHDHWLSYCVNELTRHRPDERYFRFGLRNFSGYLDFVLTRETTFPTLLELMMAAESMLQRIKRTPALQHLLEEVDLEKFYRALEFRAHHLLNGHFWPELAMFFKNPNRIAGSFFIRHHAFRVRIDDVEHYLSGFIAYRDYLLRRDPR